MKFSEFREGPIQDMYTLGCILSTYIKSRGLPFDLGKAVNLGDKFDGITIRYDENDTTKYLFSQIKHLEDPDLVIDKNILLSKDIKTAFLNNFNLKRYFESYLRIINQFDNSKKVLEKLVILTNAADLDESLVDDEKNSTNKYIELMETNEKPKSTNLYLKHDDSLIESLREVRSDLEGLVNKLITSSELDFNEDNYLNRYRYSLVHYNVLEKIDSNTCKFHQNFIKNLALSENAEILRQEIIRRKNWNQDEVTDEMEKMSWKIKQKNFDTRKFSSQILKKMVKEIVKYLREENKEIIIESSNENYFAFYHNELIKSRALVVKENCEESITVGLHQYFIDKKVSLKSSRYLRHNIREEMRDFNDSTVVEKLQNIKWTIKKKLSENGLEITKLPKDHVDDNKIIDFLNRLQFKINQPNMEDLFSKLKQDLKQNWIREYSSFILESLKKWFCENKHLEDWIPSSNRLEIYGYLIGTLNHWDIERKSSQFRYFLEDKMKDFNLKYVSKIDDFEQYFKEGISKITLLLTDEPLLTSFKLYDFLDKTTVRKPAFLDLSDEYVDLSILESVLKAKYLEHLFVKYDFDNLEVFNTLKELTSKYPLNLIVISKEDIFSSIDISDYKIFHDNKISINYIENAEIILDTEVTFQGKKVILKQISNNLIISNSMLKDIIMEEEIEIGNQFKFDNGTSFFDIKREFIYNNEKSVISTEELMEMENRIIIISGGASGGKSTVMNQIGINLKNQNPSSWVIRINLVSCSAFLNAAKEQNTPVDMDLVLKLLSFRKEDHENDLIKYALMNVGNIYLLLDSFDEICPCYKELTQNIIHLISTTMKFQKIYIATRFHTLEDVKYNLDDKFVCSLLPIDRLNREQFLIEFFNTYLEISDNSKVKIFVTELLNFYERFNGEDEFTQFPIHLQILGETFLTSKNDELHGCKEFLESESKSPIFPDNYDLIRLYQTFFDRKITIFNSEKLGINIYCAMFRQKAREELKQLYKSFTKLAILLLLDNDVVTKDFTNKIDQLKHFTNSYKMGVVEDFTGDYPQFVHRSYAEYLLAIFIYNNLKKEKFNYFTKDTLFNVIFEDSSFEYVRKFFNCLPLHNLPETDLGNYEFKILERAMEEKLENVTKYLIRNSISENKLKN